MAGFLGCRSERTELLTLCHCGCHEHLDSDVPGQLLRVSGGSEAKRHREQDVGKAFECERGHCAHRIFAVCCSLFCMRGTLICGS